MGNFPPVVLFYIEKSAVMPTVIFKVTF
jgi:hypothetical protein